MKKSLLSVILLLLFVLAGCQSNASNNTNESSAGNDNPNTTLSFKTMADMISYVPENDGAIVNLLGFFSMGDGAGGTFYWDANSGEEHNIGTVVKPESAEKGRYIRLCDSNLRNVAWFGANGTDDVDDTNAIQSALTDLKNGGTLVLEPGNYLLSSSLKIDKDGIKLSGRGNVNLVACDAMDGITIIDQANSVTLTDLNFIGGNKANHGILIQGECKGISMKSVFVSEFVSCGLKLSGKITGGIYEEVNVTSNAASSSGLSISGGANDIVFTACRFDMGAFENCVAGEFKYTHDITFQNCTFTAISSASTGTLFVGGEKEAYPKSLGFYGCDVINVVVNEEHGTIGKNHFFGFMTHNGQVVPNNDKIFGSTDDGRFFGLS